MGMLPRVVLVTRKTEYQLLIEQHATVDQARFFLKGRGQSLDAVLERDARQRRARHVVRNALPRSWRWAQIGREDLPHFLFEPDDKVVVLGQDGLVANVAKYLEGQAVLGLNPDPQNFDGVLVSHAPEDAAVLLERMHLGRSACEQRTMVEASLDDGQRLLALNEIFVGHRSHQSARYELAIDGGSELQSSSGVVVASGTGATGWARSIRRNRVTEIGLPKPQESALVFFVREAFPSRVTGTALCDGVLVGEQVLEITSRMNDGGVIFGDGIEADCIPFDWGQRLRIRVATQQLALVCRGLAPRGEGCQDPPDGTQGCRCTGSSSRV